MIRRSFSALVLACIAAFAHAQGTAPADAALDAAAFEGVDAVIAEQLTDVQSTVVMLRGRVVYQYYRDGSPDTLRNMQSTAKSALSVLVGTALQQGKLASLDQPVVALMPQWAALNADPRTATITVRHLLSMTAGFEVNDPTGTGRAGTPATSWSRPLRFAPGEKFAYDNATIPLVQAVLEGITGQKLPDYAREHLVGPLQMREPGYVRGLQMRTLDMAKLGQLYLQRGAWDGKQLVPADFVRDSVTRQNAGGPPVSLPYGYLWWVVPVEGPRPVYMASGYAGQVIWVNTAMEMVVAITSTVSEDSQRRGQAFQLLQRRLVPAAVQRLLAPPQPAGGAQPGR